MTVSAAIIGDSNASQDATRGILEITGQVNQDGSIDGETVVIRGTTARLQPGSAGVTISDSQIKLRANARSDPLVYYASGGSRSATQNLDLSNTHILMEEKNSRSNIFVRHLQRCIVTAETENGLLFVYTKVGAIIVETLLRGIGVWEVYRAPAQVARLTIDNCAAGFLNWEAGRLDFTGFNLVNMAANAAHGWLGSGNSGNNILYNWNPGSGFDRTKMAMQSSNSRYWEGRTVVWRFVDQSGSPIQNVKIIYGDDRDTTGSQVTYGTFTTGADGIPEGTHDTKQATTKTAGDEAVFWVRTHKSVQANTGAYPANTLTGVSSTQWKYNIADVTPQFEFRAYGYLAVDGHRFNDNFSLPAPIGTINNDGTAAEAVDVILAPDIGITETKTVADAYTEFETDEKLYHRMVSDWYDEGTPKPTWDEGINLGSSNLRFLDPDDTGYSVAAPLAFSQGEWSVKAGSAFTGNITTTGTIVVPATVAAVGALQDSTGVTVTITGLPAGHNAVAAAWPTAQSVTDRSNIVTGEVASDTATTVTIKLQTGFEYYVVADAVSYRRSAPFRLNTTTQTSLEISLTRIQDAAGNDLIPAESSLTDDERRQIEHMNYWSEGDTFYYRTRNGSPGFSGQTTTVQGAEIESLTLTMNNLVTAIETNAGFNGIASDANRIYALYGRRVEGAGGTIFAINKSDGLVANPSPLPASITLPGLTQQGVGVDWPTDICVVPHENELVVLWRTGGLQRIPINAPTDQTPLGAPGAIHYASFPPSVFDNTGNQPSACHGLAMRNANEAYVVFTNPHVIERVTWNTTTDRWEGDDAFPSSALSRQPVRAVAWDEVEDELIICDEDEDMLVLNPQNGRLKFGEGFDIVAGTEEDYITGMAAWGNELTTVWANTANSVSFQANDLRIRTFGIRTGTLGEGAILPVEFFTFNAVARYMEVTQSRAASQANPYVSIFTPGTITFESGSSRKVAADQNSPREIVPDLSALQITKIGAEHQKEFVNYEEGPIVVFSGNPSFASVTVPPGLEVELSTRALTGLTSSIEEEGRALRTIQSLATNIAANTQPPP